MRMQSCGATRARSKAGSVSRKVGCDPVNPAPRVAEMVVDEQHL